MNQQQHRPALHDEVLCSHSRDLQRETNATRGSEKEDGLRVPGPVGIGPEKVRLRPDQDGLADGCLDHKAPVHCPLCRPQSSYSPTCLVGPGERNQGFHVENPGYLGIRMPTAAATLWLHGQGSNRMQRSGVLLDRQGSAINLTKSCSQLDVPLGARRESGQATPRASSTRCFHATANPRTATEAARTSQWLSAMLWPSREAKASETWW